MNQTVNSIFLLSILIVLSVSQTANPTPIQQNFIEPTIVVPTNHPSPTQSAQQAAQIPQNNQQPLPNNIDGIPAQAVPIPNENISGQKAQPKPATNNQGKSQPTPETNQQQIAKTQQKGDRAKLMAEQAKRQAERDRKTREQRQEQQLRNIQLNDTLSKTQKKKQQQRLLFRKTARNVEEGTQFTEYLFEQGLGASQFFIKLPSTQQVAINLFTYVAQENTYIRTKNIEEEEPVNVYIYQNDNRIIYQAEFYYQNYIIFQGQAGAMYLIKVTNNGRTKLISMNCKKLVEEAHIEKALQKYEGSHVQRTQNLAIQISKWHQEFRKIRMLDFQDLKAVQSYIQKFYSWELFETVLAVILCVVQVNVVQKMLKGTSIV